MENKKTGKVMICIKVKFKKSTCLVLSKISKINEIKEIINKKRRDILPSFNIYLLCDLTKNPNMKIRITERIIGKYIVFNTIF